MIALIFQNHYERLQVPASATPEEIKTAFRKMARLYHPDVAKHKHNSHKSFLLIKEAYDELIDAERRRDYDQLLAATSRFKQRQQKPTPQPGSKATQTAARGNAAQSREFTGTHAPFDSRRPERPDLDIHANLEVSLEELVQGGRQNITLEKDPEKETGMHADHAFKVVAIQIPTGSHAGKVIQIPGSGYRDPLTRETGTLFLTLEIAKHDRFRVLGNDLYTSAEVYPWHAALGGMIPITTLNGMASLRIPAGSQPWQSFRMEGQGIFNVDGKRGDLIVSLKILHPPASTSQQAELWKALKAAYRNP